MPCDRSPTPSADAWSRPPIWTTATSPSSGAARSWAASGSTATSRDIDWYVGSVERELGAPLAQLDREDKQRAVKLLNDRGAFGLRRSVEQVAEAMGVSRFTVYNYLNRPEALHRPSALNRPEAG